VAGWLRGSRLWVTRWLGNVLLGLLVLLMLADSFTTYRWGIQADATCINFIDQRITGVIVTVLSGGVILTARLARLWTRKRYSRRPAGSPKPEARSLPDFGDNRGA